MKYLSKIVLVIFALFIFKTSNAQFVDCSYGILHKWSQGLAKCDSFLFVGVYDLGIYRSSNKGIDWEYKSNGINPELNSVKCFYADGSNIFAGTGNGVYFSSDYGENWIPRGFNNGSGIYGIGKSGQNIIISPGYYSSNNGISWIKCNFPHESPNIRQFASLGDTIFTIFSNIYSSFDHGVTWTLRDYVHYRFYFSIEANNNDLYAGSNEGIFKSTNRGNNWYAMNQGLPVTNTYVTTLEVHNGNLYTAYDHIIYKYSLTNSQWTPTNNFFGNSYFDCLLSFNDKLYAIADYGRHGLYYTTNDGNSWNKTKLINNNIKYLKDINNKIFACSDSSGIYTSTNNGDSWNSITINCSNFSSVTNVNSNIFIASPDSGIYKSINNGLNWIICNNGLNNINILSLDKKDSIVYAGSNTGLYFSNNLGSNWNLIGFNEKKISSISVTDSLFLIGTNTGLYFSTNNGLNWSTEYISGKTINVIKKYNNSIYAGTSSGLYLSSNNGISWDNIGQSGNYVTDVVKYADTVLFIGTNNGIYRTYDNGLSWRGMYDTGICLLDYNGYLYSGGNNIIIKGLKSSLVTDVLNVNTKITEKYNLYQNYPNPFNPITRIKFEIPKISILKIIIYDINGKEIETLTNKVFNPGVYEAEWNAQKYPSGVYFCRLTAGRFTQTIKMILIK